MCRKDTEHLLAYLLGPHTVNDGVEGRGDHQIQVGDKNVNIAWYVVPKSVSEEGEDRGNIENTHDPNMGATRVQGFEPGVPRWEAEDRAENVDVGDADKDQVQKEERDHKEPIDGIDTDVSTGQFCNAHVLTVGMSYYTSLVEG